MQTYTLSYLYAATNGPTWRKADRWLQGNPCGDEKNAAWYGLACVNGQVSSIDVHDNSLIGTLPSQLVDLPYLQALDFSHNAISGTLPTELGRLQSLSDKLDLYDTRISGTLPSQLGNLQKTLHGSLNLFWSRLSGTVPSELSRISPSECALSSKAMPTNRFECPLSDEIAQWSCTTECASADEIAQTTEPTSQHLYAMMSETRLNALPLVHSDNLLPELVSPPSPSDVSSDGQQTSQQTGQQTGQQNSQSQESAFTDDTSALTDGTTTSDTGGNETDLEGQTSALESESVAATAGTIAAAVLGSLILVVCLVVIARRYLRRRPSKNLPLLPAAQKRPKMEVDDHNLMTPRSLQSLQSMQSDQPAVSPRSDVHNDANGGPASPDGSRSLASLLQRRLLSQIYPVGRDSARRDSVVRAPAELLTESHGGKRGVPRPRVHLPGLRDHPMSNPLLDDESTPRSLAVSTPRELDDAGELDEFDDFDELGDSISQRGTPRRNRASRVNRVKGALDSARSPRSSYGSRQTRESRRTPRDAYLGDYDSPRNRDRRNQANHSNYSRSRTPSPELPRSRSRSPERRATFANDPPTSARQHTVHQAVTDNGFDLYGNLNLYGEDDTDESEDQSDQRTAGDSDQDESQSIVSRENSQVSRPSTIQQPRMSRLRSVSQATGQYHMPPSTTPREAFDEGGAPTHRSGRSVLTRSSFMSEASNEGESLIDLDNRRQSELLTGPPAGTPFEQTLQPLNDDDPFDAPLESPTRQGVPSRMGSRVSYAAPADASEVRASARPSSSSSRRGCCSKEVMDSYVAPSSLPEPGLDYQDSNRETIDRKGDVAKISKKARSGYRNALNVLRAAKTLTMPSDGPHSQVDERPDRSPSVHQTAYNI